jgi:hypothetical protein
VDTNVAATAIRDGNWDWFLSKQTWLTNPADAGETIPSSLYLTSEPAFFRGYIWPWVDPTTETTYTLPAQARYAAGTPNELLPASRLRRSWAHRDTPSGGALPMDSQRYLRLPREREEGKIGGQSSWFDPRALSGQPGVQLKTNRISQVVINVLSCCQSGWLSPPISVPCGAGEREAF